MGRIDRKELLKECAKRGSGITIYKAESMLSRLETVICEAMKKSYNIITPFFNIQPSIRCIIDHIPD